MKKNKGVITLTGGTKTIDYSSLKVAEGYLTSPLFGTADFDTPEQIKVSFESMVVGPATKDDEVLILVVNPDFDQAIVAKGTRGNGSSNVTVNVPAPWGGTTVHIYGFARATVEEPTFIENYNGNIYPGQPSNSVYIGSGNVA